MLQSMPKTLSSVPTEFLSFYSTSNFNSYCSVRKRTVFADKKKKARIYLLVFPVLFLRISLYCSFRWDSQ
jgi:hypothetical protein